MPRLIDADEAYKSILKYTNNQHGIGIKEALNRVPTVDAEPTRHGHWIDVNGDGSLWRCSVCEEAQCCYDNYCGNCGAKMDEVTEDAKIH